MMRIGQLLRVRNIVLVFNDGQSLYMAHCTRKVKKYLLYKPCRFYLPVYGLDELVRVKLNFIIIKICSIGIDSYD